MARPVRHSASLLTLSVGVALLAAALWASPPRGAPKVEFNRDILPVLSKCFACHGPDADMRMAGLRLDEKAGATKKLPSGKTGIVPGKPDQSEVIRRIFAKDEALRMPPVSSHKTLSDDEKALLRQWITEGAEYKMHWAFVAPKRLAAPKVRQKAWVRNPIDAFILARLEAKGLKPSPETDKRTLIRRVSLDLTGLPPTTAEVNAFLADKSPKAYEKVVDRLLASPRYGERMAMDWMDYARYADSNGYQADYERFQWRWRDWVINAFNSNMPYDRFTVEQLAGDMLPNPTLDQQIATGFNRNHRINTEGGVIAEEWRVENVIDRVETTSAVWLGLTTGCARCHDHKYDPVSQKEFYGLFAYFNNVPESGTGEERPVNHPPMIKAPYPEQAKELTALTKKLESLDWQIKKRLSTLKAPIDSWKLPPESRLSSLESGLVARYRLGRTPSATTGAVPSPKVVDKVKYDTGRSTGAIATNSGYVDLGEVANFDTREPFSYSVWINPDRNNGSPVSRMDAPNSFRGWDLYIQQDARPAFHFIHKWPENAFKVISKAKITPGRWTHIAMTYDGSGKAGGVRIYVDGATHGYEFEADRLTGTTKTAVSTKVGRRTGADTFPGKVDDLAIYSRVLSAEEVKGLSGVHPAAALLTVPPASRSEHQKELLRRFWAHDHDASYRAMEKDRKDAFGRKLKIDSEVTTVMVMEEMKKPRDAYLLVRGQYDKHGEKVPSGIPAALPALPAGAPNNRLGCAKWIVDPATPMTARVTVNRLWERLFGAGIVPTSEDFGTRADFPSHPELLDWLATEFVRLKWDQKAMWKTLVMSATYRQSSNVSAHLLRIDPTNKWLARGPRFRLQGEVIRDQALAVSGLLTEKIGGPSVRPYQPEGIWDEVNVYGNLRNYKHDPAPALHRRSLYTIWKRTAAPPNMTMFDVPSREACRVQRARTNTPLQALALLNDVTYVEAAKALAQEMLLKGGSTHAARIDFAFNRLLSRPASMREKQILTASIKRRVEHYKKNPDAAKKLLAQGDLKVDARLSQAEAAAYTVLASTIMNLDEAVTKE